MYKTEILCESCDEHFIIVTKETEPTYCPFCQVALDQFEEDE
jgi:hypothetical protein